MRAFGDYEVDETASAIKERDHKDSTDLVVQGCDVYNGEETGETAATVTSATGIANASGPKVMGFKPNQSAKAHGLGIETEMAPTLEGGGGGNNKPAIVSWNGDTTPKASEDVSVTLRSQQGGEGVGVAFTASDRSNKAAWEGEVSGAVNCQMNSETSNLQMGVRENLTVRRLTPTECMRLQGFDDDHCDERCELELVGNEWKATGKVVKQADGPIYKQAGNAVTVNVAEWIGKRLASLESS